MPINGFCLSEKEVGRRPWLFCTPTLLGVNPLAGGTQSFKISADGGLVFFAEALDAAAADGLAHALRQPRPLRLVDSLRHRMSKGLPGQGLDIAVHGGGGGSILI